MCCQEPKAISLDLQPTEYEENHTSKWLSQFPRTIVLKDLRRKSNDPSFLDQHNLYYILHRMLLSTDQCSYHPSSKKVLLLGSGDHHRNPPVRAEIRRSGEPKPSRYICIAALLSMAQGGWWDRGRGDCKSWNTRESVGMAFLRKSCMNKTGTMTIPIDFRRA